MCVGGLGGILTRLQIGTINFYTCSYITVYFLVLTEQLNSNCQANTNTPSK